MKRSGFKRTTPMKQGQGFLRRYSKLRSKKKPLTPIQKSAKGEECTIRLPKVCNFDRETTVLCHENGAGMGMKHSDERAAYGCSACHAVVDGQAPRPEGLSRELVQACFQDAIAHTNRILRRKGLIA